ncbi:hypothetical protein KSF_011380 [Reticulibacter mediterranei]|uniref:Pentapeptide repeat-containing protein n=1 Tax=Reticulibacter mediterranei TaxID=2778369 RepID=A0A8J3N0C2_9CHLR|nr:pentapeptide repeat-containing protein [Reticulibacter mediterranei]GHO91090.1 hypothetical protein KSF_011380 [Reticulibacter mediterranei]
MTQRQQPSHDGSVAQHMHNGQDSCGERPSNDQPAAWKAYWRSLGYPWRTEPEIDRARQELLEARRALPPDPQKSIYPFKGIKLGRADVEWLLATHENGEGPIDWRDQAQQRRQGLDLRGAVLSGDSSRGINLRGLPLSRLQGGLSREQWSGWVKTNKELLDQAAVDLEEADLFGTHLEGACLTAAHLNQADLRLAGLEGANLTGAQLEGANLTGAQLEGANLTGAQLERAYLTGAELAKANLHGARLACATLFGTQLKDAYLVGAQLEEANLTGAQLGGTNLRRAMLGRAILSGTLEGSDFAEAVLVDENGIGPRLAAVQWGKIDLSTVDWSQVKQLDDEHVAYEEKEEHGEQKDALTRLNMFKQAVRAYRQLALALKEQGLYEEAAYFSYRAHVLQCEVLRRQIGLKRDAKKRGDQSGSSWFWQLSKYLSSLFLHLATGYGYKPWRSVITYLLIIIVFALAYAVFDHVALLPNALVLSLAGFHGRGFFAAGAVVGASEILLVLEAVVGLLIEICYIVVFTRRFLEQ